MKQGCHNIFDVSRTKKGEKVVENIKTKIKVLFFCKIISPNGENSPPKPR
jgi:hypothetical protein